MKRTFVLKKAQSEKIRADVTIEKIIFTTEESLCKITQARSHNAVFDDRTNFD